MKLLPILLLSFLSCSSYAQDITDHEKIVKRSPAWFTPSKTDVINGITLSPLESFYFFNKRPQKLNGLVIHGVSVMLLAPLLLDDINQRFIKNHRGLSEEALNLAKLAEDSSGLWDGFDCNGVLLSATGTCTRYFNGVNISIWAGRNVFARGLSINALYNSSFEVRGAQIGLINYTHRLRGIQVGLWNVNRKRKLPIVNWDFSDRKKKDRNLVK